MNTILLAVWFSPLVALGPAARYPALDYPVVLEFEDGVATTLFSEAAIGRALEGERTFVPRASRLCAGSGDDCCKYGSSVCETCSSRQDPVQSRVSDGLLLEVRIKASERPKCSAGDCWLVVDGADRAAGFCAAATLTDAPPPDETHKADQFANAETITVDAIPGCGGKNEDAFRVHVPRNTPEFEAWVPYKAASQTSNARLWLERGGEILAGCGLTNLHKNPIVLVYRSRIAGPARYRRQLITINPNWTLLGIEAALFAFMIGGVFALVTQHGAWKRWWRTILLSVEGLLGFALLWVLVGSGLSDQRFLWFVFVVGVCLQIALLLSRPRKHGTAKDRSATSQEVSQRVESTPGVDPFLGTMKSSPSDGGGSP